MCGDIFPVSQWAFVCLGYVTMKTEIWGEWETQERSWGPSPGLSQQAWAQCLQGTQGKKWLASGQVARRVS